MIMRLMFRLFGLSEVPSGVVHRAAQLCPARLSCSDEVFVRVTVPCPQ